MRKSDRRINVQKRAPLSLHIYKLYVCVMLFAVHIHSLTASILLSGSHTRRNDKANRARADGAFALLCYIFIRNYRVSSANNKESRPPTRARPSNSAIYQWPRWIWKMTSQWVHETDASSSAESADLHFTIRMCILHAQMTGLRGIETCLNWRLYSQTLIYGSSIKI